MDLADIEREMARLDAVYRPVATAPVDVMNREAMVNLGATISAALAELAVDDQAQAVLHGIIARYVAGDESDRAAIRRLFDRYTSFRWAAHLPRQWDTAEELRDQLIHMSARDQGPDTRDEILALQDLCDRAGRAGIDIGPILDEVAGLSSDEDRYGMGSMRSIFLTYGRR
jgi:hypothetical protein